MKDNEFIPTRRSLLSRLRNWEDRKSWQEFFDTYSRLIHRVATKAGLTDAEADDVVQETIIIVAKKLPGFRYDPALGSFKSWLLVITRRRIEKQLQRRIPVGLGPPGQRPVVGGARSPSTGSRRASTAERVADPNGFDLEAVWNAEWENSRRDAALATLKAKLKPKQFQMFDLYVLKEWPVKEVARALGVSVAHVYVNKHRVRALLNREMSRSSAKPPKGRSIGTP